MTSSRKYINPSNVPLSVAVYLATDHYDHDDTALSATAFLKPTRQLVLEKRVPQDLSLVDVVSTLKSRMGTSIHDGIDAAWDPEHFPKALEALGYPKKLVDRVVVNPEPHEITENTIPFYKELRTYRELDGYRVSGKFDFISEGQLEDFKNTGTFTWVNNTKDDDYILQGSIYRWLNPEIVTEDTFRINFLFWDWKAFGAKADPNYPDQPIKSKEYPLMSLAETEAFMRKKLKEVEYYKDLPQEQLPLCNDKELWRGEAVYKYYRNPDKMSRATKNYKPSDFPTPAAASAAAHTRQLKDGGTGIVVHVPGDVVACKYCPAFAICTQKDDLIASGALKL